MISFCSLVGRDIARICNIWSWWRSIRGLLPQILFFVLNIYHSLEKMRSFWLVRFPLVVRWTSLWQKILSYLVRPLDSLGTQSHLRETVTSVFKIDNHNHRSIYQQKAKKQATNLQRGKDEMTRSLQRGKDRMTRSLELTALVVDIYLSVEWGSILWKWIAHDKTGLV